MSIPPILAVTADAGASSDIRAALDGTGWQLHFARVQG